MAQHESEADSPYKLECKQSALQKLRAMRQLTEALNGEGSIKFSSLTPIANIINAIVKKDRPAYNNGLIELKSCIAKKNEEVKLQDLAAIAEINFLEGFDSFISYIYVGKPPQEDADTHSRDSSNEPIGRAKSPKRRAPKRLQTQREKEEPTRKSARPMRDASEEPEQEKEKETRPTRKSTRRMFEGKVKFDCAFDGCTLEFNSAKELIAHADQCTHKKEHQLVFRCSCCKQSFPTDSDVKLHIYKSYNCVSAAIKIEAEKTVQKKSSVSTEESVDDNDIDASHEVDCPMKNCKYSSSNPDHLYVHVKHSHSEFITTFKCRECGETRLSGKALKNHITNACAGANFELKLSAKADDTEAKLHSATTDTLNDPTKEWDAVLRKCPIRTCGFASTAARNLPLHFKRNHPESSVSFQCSKCDHSDDSIQEVMTHCTACPDSRPEVLLNGQPIKRTPRSRCSLPPSTMVMRKRGRSSIVNTSTNKEGEKISETDEADMPVLEMIELGDDDDDDMAIVTTKKNEKEDDTIDVVSMDDEVKVEEMGADREVDNALNLSDDESSVL